MTTPPQKLKPISNAVLLPLRAHVDFVVRACDAFDAGAVSEVKRCAVALRSLFHSPAPFLSLLAQAEGLHGNFLSTALPGGSEFAGRYGSLVLIAKFDGRPIYFPALDSAWYGRWLKFSEWWNEPVFVDDERKELTRRDVVLTVADKDGGPNVDPKLDMLYERLSMHESTSVAEVLARVAAQPSPQAPSPIAGEPATQPERAALRQIAHEALRTLIPTYRKFQQVRPDPRLNSAMEKAIERPASLPMPPAIRRNDLCPCGSGKKLKYCHGAI